MRVSVVATAQSAPGRWPPLPGGHRTRSPARSAPLRPARSAPLRSARSAPLRSWPVRRGHHDGQAGRICGCFTLLLLVVLLVAGGAVLWVEAGTTPDLGPPPRGPDDGSSVLTVGATLAARLAPELAIAGHATVSLSERDLTVIARQENPEPDRIHDPEVRIRDGLVVIDARTDLGPVGIAAVGRFRLHLVTDPDGRPDIGLSVVDVQAGRIPLPGLIRDLLERRIRDSLGFGGILQATPLSRFRADLDCVAVLPSAVVLGFHRPGTPADPTGCTG